MWEISVGWLENKKYFPPPPPPPGFMLEYRDRNNTRLFKFVAHGTDEQVEFEVDHNSFYIVIFFI